MISNSDPFMNPVPTTSPRAESGAARALSSSPRCAPGATRLDLNARRRQLRRIDAALIALVEERLRLARPVPATDARDAPGDRSEPLVETAFDDLARRHASLLSKAAVQQLFGLLDALTIEESR